MWVWQLKKKSCELIFYANEWKLLQIFCTTSFLWRRPSWWRWVCIFGGLSWQRQKEITSSTAHFLPPSVWETLSEMSDCPSPTAIFLFSFLLFAIRQKWKLTSFFFTLSACPHFHNFTLLLIKLSSLHKVVHFPHVAISVNERENAIRRRKAKIENLLCFIRRPCGT